MPGRHNYSLDTRFGPTLTKWQRRRCHGLKISAICLPAILLCTTLLLLSLPPRVQAFRVASPWMPSSISPAAAFRVRATTITALYGRKNPHNEPNNGDKGGRKDRRRQARRQAATGPPKAAHNATNGVNGAASASNTNHEKNELADKQRISQLEDLVARQTVEIKRLKDDYKSLAEAVSTFASAMELLREAGLGKDGDKTKKSPQESDDEDDDDERSTPIRPAIVQSLQDDDEIFGKAPSSVMDAADAAGAAVLAGLLAGQRRLLVDVRDAELVDPAVLVQFMELAILPVAAGLEGLRSKRNRLKLVFPKVSQLLEYRKTMALAAPEVVALSTMDFDPIEAQDNLVVVLAPHPDDTEGVQAMHALLDPKSGITQPVVVLNPYMAPISGPAADFCVAYQLRLYTVHYMANPPPLPEEDNQDNDTSKDQLEAAMQHAKEVSRNPTEHSGTTRAMVIRAYPNPWNVFVDTSPDTDADFCVAATFADEPTPDQVNKAIIECLEGSEEEDELVAQQMQQALESGQLDKVTELLGSMGLDFFDDDDDDEDEDDDDEDLWRLQDVDTV